MINFLKETIDCIENYGKKIEDVLWVGANNCNGDKIWEDWDNFARCADFEYDNSFGLDVIIDSLIVVGKDWWLERHEYDGSEWWEFKCIPEKPDKRWIMLGMISLVSGDLALRKYVKGV
jgi:hypothetical protein